MTQARYEELLGLLLDGGLSAAQAGELAGGLDAHPEFLRDLREHLVLWELWSQAVAPERSGEAFLAAWQTRLRAETEAAGSFDGRVLAQVAATRASDSRWARMAGAARRLAGAIRRPAGIAWAAGAACALVLGFLWLAAPHPARAEITIRGEAVCTACVLHEGHDHAPAIRVTVHGATRIYYLDHNPEVDALQNQFCNGPVPAEAEGTEHEDGGRLRFSARSVAFPAPAAPPAPQERDRRILFPI